MYDTPGVYVRELPSGVRSISGVATSNTAFVGCFARGPVNQATRVNSFGEFERIFGGLGTAFDSSYGVRNFFLNGGAVAFIVRVTAGVATTAAVTVPGAAGLQLVAAFTGVRGNDIRVGIAHAGAASTTFDILVRGVATDGTAIKEEYPAVSITSGNPSYVTTELAASALVRVTGHASGVLPEATVLANGTRATTMAELLAAPLGALAQLTGGTAAPAAAQATLPGGPGLQVVARSHGAWGNALRLGVSHAGAGSTAFDLLVREYRGTEVMREESFSGLQVAPGGPRHAATVLEAESELVRITGAVTLPDRTVLRPAAGADPQVDATTMALLQSAAAARLVALQDGADGLTPANSDAWRDAVGASIGGSEAGLTGVFALDRIAPEVFNILCLPDLAMLDQARMAQAALVYQTAHAFCQRHFAFLVVDAPQNTTQATLDDWTTALGATVRRNAALYYPQLTGPDPLNPATPRRMPPSGAVAGIYARTDATRGVWKAPAGTDAGLVGGRPVETLTDGQHGPLNVAGINILRTFPVYNAVIWGARTLEGADALASEWRYIPVRRLALYIQDSLTRGLQWVVFEPNDEPLWASVRLNVTAFMSGLHRQGAFQGASARDAFLVKCDAETTTPVDVNLGVLNLYVGFAPVRPAEFVVLQIQQRFQTAS
jgi:phage tail sheath protein FI